MLENITSKVCTKCKIAKSTSLFKTSKRNKTGFSSWCRKCDSEHGNKRYRDVLSKDVNYKYKAHISQVYYFYGITEDDYKELLVKQDYACAICLTHQDELNSRLAVDHCHKTNVIRGLLCGKCNRGLGIFQDSEELLNKAIKYLGNI